MGEDATVKAPQVVIESRSALKQKREEEESKDE